MENIEEQFGAVVRSLRLAAGMTQEQLAQAVTSEGWAVRQNTIAKLENGMRPTTIAELSILASVFDMTPREFAVLVYPPKAGDADETEKQALKQSLAMKRAHLKTSRRELATLEQETAQLRQAVAELELSIKELEDQIGEHPEEA